MATAGEAQDSRIPTQKATSKLLLSVMNIYSLQELMKERTQTYPVSSLRNRTDLPEGIDLKNLEQYLRYVNTSSYIIIMISDADFSEVFKMDRPIFATLPAWKQIRLRKDAGLF